MNRSLKKPFVLLPKLPSNVAFFQFSSDVSIRRAEDQSPPPRELEPSPSTVSNRAYWAQRIHSLCVDHRDPDGAVRLLDCLCLLGHRPDPLSLASVVHALCDARRFPEARRRLILSAASPGGGFLPDTRTCNVLVARILDSGDPYGTLEVVNCLCNAKLEFVPSLVNYNRLINQLCSVSGAGVCDAHSLFFDMKRRGHIPSTVSYTTMIRGYCRIGDTENAQKLFDEMSHCGILPNSLTYSTLICGFLHKYDAKQITEMIQRLWAVMNREEDPTVNSAAFSNLIESLCKKGYVSEVFRIAEEMIPQWQSVPEEFAYGQMIDSLCKVRKHHGASRIVYIMRKRGVNPSLVSYNSIIHGLSKEGEGGFFRAYQLLEEGTKFGFVPSEFTYKVLVENLARGEDLPKARKVFELMLEKSGADKTRICNIFLRSLCLVKNPTETELLNMFEFMVQNKYRPDVITLNTIINGFCKMEKIEEAITMLQDMRRGEYCVPNAVTYTTIICGLLRIGNVKRGLDFLNRFFDGEDHEKPGIVTYNAVLRGLFQIQRVEEAQEVFGTMEGHRVVPDQITYAIMIDGLCDSGCLDKAKKFWNEVVWPSGKHDNYVYAALLKGFCKFGEWNKAWHFLYDLVDSGVLPNVVCYNIMIDKVCKLGLKKEAYQILEEMRKNGVCPDSVTWRILDKVHSVTRK